MYTLRRGLCCAHGGSGPYWWGYSRVLTGHSAALAGGRRRRRTRGYFRVLRSTARVPECNGCCGTAEGRAWRCRRAQARTSPETGAATSARRAPRGSRPRRRAAPQWPPRAKPRGRLSCFPTLLGRGAATTTSTATRPSTPTRSAPETLTTSCCAPPVRRVPNR